MLQSTVVGLALGANVAHAAFSYKGDMQFSNSGESVSFHKIRGSGVVADSASGGHWVNYPHTVEGSFSATNTEQFSATTGYSLSENEIVYAGDLVTGNMLFASEYISSINSYHVNYYRGEYSQWSVYQILAPPDEFHEQNYFGQHFSINRQTIREMVIACPGCNITHTDGGALYIYEATKPDAMTWTATSVLTATSELTMLGKGVVSASYVNSVGVSIDRNHIVASAILNTIPVSVVYGKEHGKYSQLQTLALGHVSTDEAFNMDVYDETITLGSFESLVTTSTGSSSTGKIGIYYPSTERYNLAPKGKPRPVQWSLQQTLIAPDLSTSPNFGYATAIFKNRLVTGSRTALKYFVYERETLGGKWSLQQMLTFANVADRIEFYGSTFIADTESGVHLFDETEKWDCLLVSVEDHFNDGWDTAKLTVDVPGGEKDFFTSRCELPNPFQFRYCPADIADGGLYKFSVPNGNKAKFHWEQVWRVYEESTGNWYTGNWDTKMDFEWNPKTAQFHHKKIERELPNNITCVACKSKPPSKPSSRLRQLHSKDSTVAPTISPAPTILTSVQIHPWQELRLISSSATTDWFDSQHKGTSYYISDKGGHRLLSVGTMCPWQREATDGHVCWEDYPDGEYILRVGGALDRNSHTFKFCNSANEISSETQIVFRVTNGECSIVSTVKSQEVCGRAGTAMVANFDLHLTGVFNLGKSEYHGISEGVATMMSGVKPSDVKVVSAVSDGTGTTVSVDLHVHASTTGFDFTNAETIDSFESAALKTFFGQSAENKLWLAFTSEETQSKLHDAVSVNTANFILVGTEMESVEQLDSPPLVSDMADATHADYVSTSESKPLSGTIKALGVTGYVVAGVGVLLIAAIAMSRPRDVVTSANLETPTAVSDEMSQVACEGPIEAVRTTQKAATRINNDSKLSLLELQELVSAEDAALKTLLRTTEPKI